ncbi:M81 family metallopeptidase [Streptomyces olivaceus]|uniref:M81 family metallopeptidase n=1 Tax=Streptomyces olivaceus TaxID=47716 RepID=UPI0035DFB500
MSHPSTPGTPATSSVPATPATSSVPATPATSSVPAASTAPARRPVIAIAGLGIESSTFSPARTEAPAFHPSRGQEVLDRYPFLAPGEELREAADWHGALVGKSLPGGTVTAAAWEELTAELLTRLAALPAPDGLWFDIHGAMTVEGVDDAEALLLQKVRSVVGDGVIVSTSMDLHGNVSRALVHRSDLITCYRMAPHEDHMETKERAVRNLLAHLASGAPRPLKAWVPVPVLLAGEQTSTRIEPAKSVYAAVDAVEAQEGVTDAAIWVGYAWADEPRNRAAVVVTGHDEHAVSTGAERLARGFWEARRDFDFVAPTGTFDAILDEALAGGRRPYYVSDTGDNPTAGGAGDVTWGLARLLARPEFQQEDGPTVLYASVPGPEAVRQAAAAGVGATVTVTAGAEVDDRHAGPVTLTGVVHAVRHGDRDARTEVVVRVGSAYVILTELRKPYHHEHDFTDLDLDPRGADVVVVKIGYLEPELFAMAADWKMALTPGGVDQDLVRLGHRRIRRPMFPFDPDMAAPDLSARFVPAADQPLTGADE